jgi:hypothetical protein
MPHQQTAVDLLSNRKVLCGGVGTGKTLTALAYQQKNEADKPLYIITTARKRDELDWVSEAAKFGLSTALGNMTVDSWNNIPKYTMVTDAFFIFDEQRLVGAGAWVKSFLKIAKQNNWIMLSATPGDTWMDYIPLFLANGLYKNRTEFIREHVIYSAYSKFPKVSGYRQVSTLDRWRSMLLVEMPYLSHTVRRVVVESMAYDAKLYHDVKVRRWHIFEHRPLKDAGEMFRVMKRLIWSDPSRKTRLIELIEQHKKLVVFYNFDYELDILRTLSDVTTVGEWNGHKKTDIPDADSWVYLVQYMSGAEGWNCIDTDAMAFYSMTYSWKLFEQAQGRIDRLNTPFKDLWYYVLSSDSILDRGIMYAISNKKSFQEGAFVRKHGLGFGAKS